MGYTLELLRSLVLSPIPRNDTAYAECLPRRGHLLPADEAYKEYVSPSVHTRDP